MATKEHNIKIAEVDGFEVFRKPSRGRHVSAWADYVCVSKNPDANRKCFWCSHDGIRMAKDKESELFLSRHPEAVMAINNELVRRCNGVETQTPGGA